MGDLVRWLGKQLDEDERQAKARRGIFPSPGVDEDGAVWLHVRPGGNAVIVRQHDPVEGYDDLAKLRNWADAEHGWTQERVLREIEAKRQTIREYQKAIRMRDEREPNTTSYRHWDNRSFGLYTALRHAVAVYADRPGYAEALAAEKAALLADD